MGREVEAGLRLGFFLFGTLLAAGGIAGLLPFSSVDSQLLCFQLFHSFLKQPFSLNNLFDFTFWFILVDIKEGIVVLARMLLDRLILLALVLHVLPLARLV